MTSQEETFAQKLEKLVAAFELEERADETDAEITVALLEFILGYERLRQNVTAGTNEAKVVDAQTIIKMSSWDSNDPSMSTVEKVLRRLAEGRSEDGVKLLKDAIQISSLALSKKQAAIAKHPRKSQQQPMSGLVEQILRQEPEIKQHQLFLALKRMLITMDDPPYRHSGNSFKPRNKQFHEIKNDAIGQYRYRAKKKLSP